LFSLRSVQIPPAEMVECGLVVREGFMSQPGAAAGKTRIPQHPQASQPAVQRAINTAPTGTQLATAFDGRLEPVRTSPLYFLATFFVFIAMVLLPIVYLAIITGAAAGVYWYAVHATGMFHHVRGGRVVLLLGVAYVAPLIAGGLLVLFMILPLF